MWIANWQLNRLAKQIAATLRRYLSRVEQFRDRPLDTLAANRFVLGFVCAGVAICQKQSSRYGMQTERRRQLLLKVMQRMFALAAPQPELLGALLKDTAGEQDFKRGVHEAFARLQQDWPGWNPL